MRKIELDKERQQCYISIDWNDSELAQMMKESMIKKMREKGLKLTPQRLAIIDILIEKNLLHPSARTIYDAAKRKNQGIKFIDGLFHPQ